MNNLYLYQFSHDDSQIYEFTKLIPDPNHDGNYLRIDKHCLKVEHGSSYDSVQDLEEVFQDDFNTFKLWLTYD